MLRLLFALLLLTLPARAATWFVEGAKDQPPLRASADGLTLDGGVWVNGRVTELRVSPSGELLVSPDYAEVYDFGNASCSAQLYTGTGIWMNQELTLRVYPYRDSPDGKIFAPCSQTALSDYTSDPFGLQLFLACEGAFSGFYVELTDNTGTYSLDAGSQTLMTVTGLSGWTAGPVLATRFLPYGITTGALPWENSWRLYTLREENGRTVYGENSSSVYAADYSGLGWAATLHWPETADATAYILHNETTGFWIKTSDTTLRDDGNYALWNAGAPQASPVSPFRDAPDFFCGSNAVASVRINGAGQFETTVQPGASPLKVDSATLNENLNADFLDGQHASAFQPAGNYLSDLAAGDGITVTRNGSVATITSATPWSYTPARWQIIPVSGLSFLTGANPPVRTLASSANPAYGLGWQASPTNTEADFCVRVPYGNALLDPTTGLANKWHFGINLRLTNPSYTAPFSNVTFTVCWNIHWLNGSAWSSGSRTVTQGITHVAPTSLDFGTITNNGLGAYDSLIIRGWLRRVPSNTNDAPGRIIVDSLDIQWPFDTFGAQLRTGDKLAP